MNRLEYVRSFGTVAAAMVLGIAGRSVLALDPGSRGSEQTSQIVSLDHEVELSLARWSPEPSDHGEAATPMLDGSSSHPDRVWRFSLAPYLWMTSLRTELETGSISTDSELCFTDLLKSMELGAQLRFEGFRDQWGFFLDGTYFKLGGDATVHAGPFKVRGIDIETEFTQAWLDFGGLYRFGQDGHFFDVMAGGRFAYLEVGIDAPLGLEFEPSFDSVAPMFGGRWHYALSDHWNVTIGGDMSGFGVGDAADLAWGVTGLMGYRLSERITLGFGYRYYHIHYDEDDLDATLQFHGPLLGMVFHF